MIVIQGWPRENLRLKLLEFSTSLWNFCFDMTLLVYELVEFYMISACIDHLIYVSSAIL